MSLTTDYHILISRGRKAGLTTRELYAAMAARRVEGTDAGLGRSDCNGFVSSVNPQGQHVYRPLANYPRVSASCN